MLLAVELGSWTLIHVKRALFNRSEIKDAWMAEYEKEDKNLRTIWHPYNYWRLAEIHGKYINVDKDGLRETTRVGFEGKKVFMFGGSTMFGTYVKDSDTIPSFIQEKIGDKIQVTNFGQHGYVSTQELIEFARQLQKGNVPDVAVFYDGVNDTYTPYQGLEAGLAHNEFFREREFNCSKYPSKLISMLLCWTLDHSSAFHLLTLFKKKNKTHVEEDVVKEALRDAEVFLTYKRNVSLIRAMGNAYGVKTLFYWQPNIYNKRCHSPFEMSVLDELEVNSPGLKELYLHAGIFTKEECKKFGASVISDIFDSIYDQIYYDWCHVNARGNSMVADVMAKDILKELK